MAIVKVNYIKRDKSQKHRAKAAIRYIQHRPGKDGQKLTRTLFGSDGVMARQDAYSLIDQAGKGSILFRFILSPDPLTEDNGADLDMRLIAMQTMQEFAETRKLAVQWVAAEHADHVPHRHVHLLAVVPGRLAATDLELLRTAATNASLAQRQELDRDVQQPRATEQQQRKGGGWEPQR